MRSIKRSLRVCGSLLKYLFTSPAPYMAALALILFLWDRSFELGRIARQYRLSIHAGGYFSVLVNHSLSLIMLSFGLVFILGDAPFLHENAMFEWIRSDRKSWTAGRVLYIAAVVLIYMLFIQMMICLLSWSLNFGPKWDKVLTTLSTGRSAGGVSMHVPGLLIAKWNPLQAMGLTWLLLFLAWFALGLILFALSAAARRLAALAFVSALVFSDYLIETMMPYRAYFYSPLSWAKLTVIGDDMNPYAPSMSFALKALPLLCIALLVLSLWAGMRKKHMLDSLYRL